MARNPSDCGDVVRRFPKPWASLLGTNYIGTMQARYPAVGAGGRASIALRERFIRLHLQVRVWLRVLGLLVTLTLRCLQLSQALLAIASLGDEADGLAMPRTPKRAA
jgi:hypothetical protein